MAKKKENSTSAQKLSSRDHRTIGQKLDLFSFHDVAPGAPFWHAKGMIIFKELERKIREINDEHGYQEISTPIMVKRAVFEKSGHWQHYRKNMFYFDNPVDKNEHLVIKPMNCPESTYVFNSKIRSHHDLPVRLAEIDRLHRNELSGTLGGLFRVRQMTMDDAHIYCLPEQAETEVTSIIKIIDGFYKIFGFKTNYVLATRPEKFLGTKEDWNKSEKALEEALKKAKIKYGVEKGEGAFYGPKIEAHATDSQGRSWQMGTAQLDLVMLPKQFKTYYIDENGSKKLPWVIHRAIFGTFERFIGMLLEETSGALPVWLSPVQVALLPISDKQKKYCLKIARALKKDGIRIWIDDRNETLGKKIREAELQKIPYLLVAGEKEVKENTVTVRKRGQNPPAGGQKSVKLDDFLKKVGKELNQ